MTSYYKLNDSIVIIPEKNIINNVRLEPRIMKLLVFMMENRGKLLSRDEIIHTVWEGYPGGDDGMNQAISHLRKVLDDKDRTLIETIPKSGYVFHGSVEKVNGTSEDPDSTSLNGKKDSSDKNSRKFSYFKFALLLIALVILIIWLNDGKKDNLAPRAPGSGAGSNPAMAPKAP